MTSDGPGERLEAAAARLRRLGIDSVESYAWRDLDDPDAGGSELHADEIFRRWAEVGVTITHRTSTVDRARSFSRNGYDVIQQGGRFDVFARVIGRQSIRRRPPSTATIEIWNGVPWFGPLWAPRRRVVWMHHVHREMWDDALPFPLSAGGRLVETRIAPLVYRGSNIATLSDSSAAEIRALGIEHLTVIPPGVHERFTPDRERRSVRPHVVIVGRLAPVKRQRLALEALERARRAHPMLTVDIVGDGPDRSAVAAWIAEHEAAEWVRLLGRVDDTELLEAYRRAWLVVSASHAEGWGMSLTEGGACATPCVATDIAGHRGAAEPDRTGLLVSDHGTPASVAERLGDAVTALLADDRRRNRLAEAAVDHAAVFSWTSVATRHLSLLGDSVGQSDSAGVVDSVE
ncbi:MAG: glycosyltransferase family 4 protein [Acidimicrobiia bacterium]|nr:glycosyltransferase family 4 protein [Acidimicrobiia bacterium]